MFVRLMRPGENELMLSLDAHIQRALAACQRCAGIYQQTGLVPVSCHVCGAERDALWLACIEEQARKQPILPKARPAIATAHMPIRQIG